jgi:hypothetical protein
MKINENEGSGRESADLLTELLMTATRKTVVFLVLPLE